MSLRYPFYYRLFFFFQMALPTLVTLGLTIFMSLNFQLRGDGYFMPHLVLLSIFYWCIFYPNLLPKIVVFALGLFFDLVFKLPLGVSSLQFLVLAALIQNQHKFMIKQPFYVMWGVLGLMLFAVGLMQWVIFMLYFGQTISPSVLVIQYLLTVAIYPLFHRLFNPLYKLCEYSPS